MVGRRPIASSREKRWLLINLMFRLIKLMSIKRNLSRYRCPMSMVA